MPRGVARRGARGRRSRDAVRRCAKTARIHGVILDVTPANGEAIVRHDPFDGMPSMAMPFRIVPRARAAELLPGNVIDATADTATDPWTLRDVTISPTQALSAPAARAVVPLHAGETVPETPFVDQTGRPFRFSHAARSGRRLGVHLHALPGSADVSVDLESFQRTAARDRDAQRCIWSR